MSPRSRNSVNTNKCKWTKRETSRLVASIQLQLKECDPYIYSRRLKLLDWEQIHIPLKSVEECKYHFNAMIKKIHRIRTLAEILSDVDVEPFDFSLCDNVKNDIKRSVVVSDCSHNKRLSYIKKQLKPKRSYVTPFMLFAKSSSTKDTSKYGLKRRYNQLSDSEKMFWIEQSITSASKNDKFKESLTKDERFLLTKDLKRKFTNDAAMNVTNRKIRKAETHIDVCSMIEQSRKSIQEPKPQEPQSPDAEEIVALIENNECTNGLEAEMEIPLENNVLEIHPIVIEDISLLEEDIETTEIGDQMFPNNVTNDINNILVGYTDEIEAANQEDQVDLDTSILTVQCDIQVEQQEIRESPPVYARIKSFCSGFFSYVATWGVNN